MKLAKLQLDFISEQIDPFAIKNFIVSDQATSSPSLSLEHPFILDGVAFSICIKGTGRIKINFREYKLEKNSIVTIFPHFITELVEKSDDFMLEFLIFSVDFLSEMPSSPNFDISQSLVDSPCIKATDHETEKLIEFHSFVVKQYKRKNHPFRSALAQSLLYSLLIEVGAIYYTRILESGSLNKATAASHQEELVQKFFELLVKHHKEEKVLSFYADKMCLTPKYLSAVLRERTGRTAFSWINESLIATAKYLLKTSDMTILQISEEMNFPNASFFGRFFKKHTGMTPVQYRDS